MTQQTEDSPWVYVVVQEPVASPQLLGQHDAKNDTAFIPAFLEKNDAKKCLPLMAKESGKTYEVEAMRLDAVAEYAGKNGFAVTILKADGTVIEEITPKS